MCISIPTVCILYVPSQHACIQILEESTQWPYSLPPPHFPPPFLSYFLPPLLYPFLSFIPPHLLSCFLHPFLPISLCYSLWQYSTHLHVHQLCCRSSLVSFHLHLHVHVHEPFYVLSLHPLLPPSLPLSFLLSFPPCFHSSFSSLIFLPSPLSSHFSLLPYTLPHSYPHLLSLSFHFTPSLSP